MRFKVRVPVLCIALALAASGCGGRTRESAPQAQKPEAAEPTQPTQSGGGLEGSLVRNSYVREYTSNGKTVRSFSADLKAANFKGNRITSVSGDGALKSEAGTDIAKGPLEVVDGRIAVRGVKGARFMRLETLDTWSLSGAAASADPGRPSGEVASVTVTPDDTWVLDDDRFYFLVDSSYGLQPDFAASFARNTLFRLPPGKAVQLGSDIVTADGEGGEVTVRNGKIVDKRRVRVGAAGAPR